MRARVGRWRLLPSPPQGAVGGGEGKKEGKCAAGGGTSRKGGENKCGTILYQACLGT